jgi:hypothetical protein
MKPKPKITWETCWKCNGSGMGQNAYTGDWDDGGCWECSGEGVIRIRDERGRFASKPTEAAP